MLKTIRTPCICLLLLSAMQLAVVPCVAQDRSVTAKCLSLQNIDERVDCLESGGASSNVSQPVLPAKPIRVGPSFDCRAATTSIERAICGDPDLSEWDARMAQQYQQVQRQRKAADAQALLESQRSWIYQRNTACGAVAGTAVWSCIMDMTKQRIAALSETPATVVEAPSAPPPSQTSPSNQAQTTLKNQGLPSPSPPSTLSADPPQSAAPKSNAPSDKPSDGPNPLFVILFVIFAIVGVIVVFNNIKRRENRQRLVAKYGPETADRILARQVWLGMTQDQLLESWGSPADRDCEIQKTKTRETWKYGQTGKNRFSSRVFLENGEVIKLKQ
jgi:uncharacterized protein